MIIGILQPYLFPYIGYFQLISYCDIIVLHDDVQYISGGWINRNRILVNGVPTWLTLPVCAAPHSRAINQRSYTQGEGGPARIVNRIKSAYHKATEIDRVLPVITDIMAYKDSNVADFNAYAIAVITRHLNIDISILRSSAIPGLDGLKGVDRVIALCKALGASTYVNPIGGIGLYAPDVFAEAGIDLCFLKALPRAYPQFTPSFIPCLSVVDVMMHNDQAALMNRLAEYCIMEPSTGLSHEANLDRPAFG